MSGSTRRELLQSGLSSAALAGLGDLSFLSRLGSVSAADAKAAAARGLVSLDSGIEPVVRMIEETPRNRLLETVAGEIRNGLSYQDVLAGLLLAGVRNIEPRPSVGFKFHAVLVVNSAHLASLASPAEHRWLPIFWALDYYKSAAARDVAERGDWTMGPVEESAVPRPHRAGEMFQSAMDAWDEARADAATAALARTAGAQETYERFFRYGARDFRSIGHKAIYVANSYRTLQCIGWRHAEPVLRSLSYALLMHEDENPSRADYEADRPYRRNLDLAPQIRAEWLDGGIDSAGTTELLQTLRNGSNDEACDLVVELLNRGVGPQSVWDALQVGAGELLMRQPGIVGLHAMTTTNALQFAFQTSGNDETRRLLLLQSAAFLPMFRQAMENRGKVRDTTVDALAGAGGTAGAASDQSLGGSSPSGGGGGDGDGDGIEEIFAAIGGDGFAAARRTLDFLRREGSAASLIDAARVLVYLKGNDAHDYKFSSAVLEDYYHVSPAWRDKYLALSTFNLRGSGEPDNALVERTRAALQV